MGEGPGRASHSPQNTVDVKNSATQPGSESRGAHSSWSSELTLFISFEMKGYCNHVLLAAAVLVSFVLL